MRTRFDEQLRQLNVELIRMGSLCEEAISIAAKFLEGDKKAPVDKVFALEHEMDQLEHDIETRCMRMLLQQQPGSKRPAYHFRSVKDDFGYGTYRRSGG